MDLEGDVVGIFGIAFGDGFFSSSASGGLSIGEVVFKNPAVAPFEPSRRV